MPINYDYFHNEPLSEGEEVYLFRYNFKGKTYGLDLIAKSKEEAMQEIWMMSQAEYDGVLKQTIKVTVPGTGLWVRFKVWFNNWIRKK